MTDNKINILKNKRAEVEVQFNWIFALIVGSLILGFFAMVVYQQKSSSETKIEHEVLSKFDTILAAASTSKDKIERKETPDVDFRFNYMPGYIVGTQSHGLDGKFIFAPSYFKGDSFSIWVKAWNLDFDIVNFIYVTNPTIRYHLIADPADAPIAEFAKTINASIERKSDSESKETLVRMDLSGSSSDITDNGYKQVRLIYFRSASPSSPPNVPSALMSRPSGEITALVVVPYAVDDPITGKLYFYKYKKGTGLVPDESIDGTTDFNYLGKELLYGAIFIDKANSYQNMYGKAMKKLALISRIYENRSIALNANLDPALCAYPDGSFRGIYEAIDTDTSPINIDAIKTNIENLKIAHESLLDKSCPSLY